MKLPSILSAILFALSLAILPAAHAEKETPPYPGQPNINVALKALGNAQTKATTNKAEALEHLQKAAQALSGAINNKGTFARTAERLSEQAFKHLQKDETETALKEITEAIEATHKAAKIGSR